MIAVAAPPAPLTELAAIEHPPVPDPRKPGTTWRRRMFALASAVLRTCVLLAPAALVAWPEDHFVVAPLWVVNTKGTEETLWYAEGPERQTFPPEMGRVQRLSALERDHCRAEWDCSPIYRSQADPLAPRLDLHRLRVDATFVLVNRIESIFAPLLTR